MILDTLNEFADDTAVDTGAPGTKPLGNYINAEVVRNLGAGHPLYLVINVTQSLASGTGTIKFRLVSDNVGPPTGAGGTIHFETAEFAAADLPAGTRVAAIALPQQEDYQQYVGLEQVVGTAAFTAGAVDAALVLDVDSWKPYPQGNVL